MATARENIEYIAANREMFPEITDERIAELETLAVRGDMLLILANQKKTSFSEDARGVFADMLSALAAEMVAGVIPSGTSGHHQVGVPTQYGELRVILDPSK